MKSNKKIPAFVLCVILITILISSYFFITENIQHDCSEHECPICLELETALQVISNIKEMLTFGILLVTLLSVFTLTCREDIFFIPTSDTLITMKIKLLI